MIAAAVVAVVAALVWVFDKMFSIRREVKIAKAEDSHKEAKEIVDSKTTSDLVDAFNKRYAGADGKSDDDSKGSTG